MSSLPPINPRAEVSAINSTLNALHLANSGSLDPNFNLSGNNLLASLIALEQNSNSAYNTLMQQNNQKVLDFNAAQAELNREFQQQSAKEAMDFSAAQALLNREFQNSQSAKAMAFEAEQAQMNRDFQQRLSDTAYQRAMGDLKAAGLNPILAYASPSSTPSGSSGHGFAGSGSSAQGVAASGSAASGSAASGSKSNDLEAVKALYQYSVDSVSNTAKMLSAIGSIVPF